MVQWLRLHAPIVEGLGPVPCQGTRSRLPQLRALMPLFKGLVQKKK